MAKTLSVLTALFVGRVECKQCQPHGPSDPNPPLDCGAKQCCYPQAYFSGAVSSLATCTDSTQSCCTSDFSAKACSQGFTCCGDLSSDNMQCCDDATQICDPTYKFCKDKPANDVICGGAAAPVVHDCKAQNHGECNECPAHGQSCGSGQIKFPVSCVSTAGHEGCALAKDNIVQACALDDNGNCCYVQAAAASNTIV